jgi:rubrerythrin
VEPNILLDQFQSQSSVEELDLVSDASVFVDRCKAAVAFQIQNEAEERFFASIPMEAYPGTYSYREELRGLFLGLKLSIAKFPTCKTLTCHCDCESGIRKLTTPIQSPGQLMAPDMDVVLAIKKIVQDAGPEMEVTFKHIRGHPEKRKRREDFTPIERMNADCDEYADICAIEHTPVPFRPFEGSRCMMKIGSQWISTRVDQALQLGYVEKPLKHYISTRLEMSAEAVEHIDQDVIAAARAPHKWARTARISKLMYDCLPVGHNWRQHGAESDQCPCCGSPDKTFEHLVHCCDEGLNAVRCESIEDMVETASHKRIPEAVSVVIFGIVRRLTESREPTIPSESSPALLRAWKSQKQIRFQNMVKGWVTKDWSRAMRAHGSKDPDGHVIMILTLLWDGFFEPVWEYRNNRLHRMENSAMSSMMRTLGDRLQWFQDNKTIVLAPRHYMLVEFRVEDVQRWDRRARRMQLLMLEKARKIYAIECKQRVSGQQVITDLFPSRAQLQKGRARTVSDEED